MRNSLFNSTGGVLLLAAALWAVPPASAAGSVDVAVPVASYEITQSGRGHELAVPDFGHLLVPGKPLLPARIYALAIPPGATVTSVTWSSATPIVLPGEYTIPPTDLPRALADEDPALRARDQAEYDANYAAVYGHDAVYPAAPVEFVRTAGYRRYNLVDVRIVPFAYQPQSRRLTYYPGLTVHVEYALPESPVMPLLDNPARCARTAQDIVLNYTQAAQWYPGGGFTDGAHDYVIITLADLVDDVAPLVNWETTKGRNVEVVTTDWIDANYTGYDLAEKMRNFLREKYPAGEWGIEDVLLVGDYDDVPMRRVWQDRGYGKPETDYYYAELSKPDSESWDANKNQCWCEDSDPIDFYNEVSVGRIPWSDPATVAHICSKSIAYEQSSDSSFKMNILLLGAFFWEDTDNAVLMEAKINQPWMADWTRTRMYEQGHTTYPMDYNLTNQNVVNVWSKGKYGFVNWAGHGSPTSAHVMYTDGSAFIRSADCPQLNDDYPAVIFACACSNSDTDELNIGQSMLKQGGVGFLGATKVAYGKHGWDDPYDGTSASMDYFFTVHCTAGEESIGQAHQWSLREMYTHNLWYYQKYEHCEWAALWGNPNLYCGGPRGLTLSFPEGLPELCKPGAPVEIVVQVNENDEHYMPDTARVHWRYQGGAYESALLQPLANLRFQATLPAPACYDSPEFYFSAQGDVSGVVYAPANAPNSAFSAVVGEIATIYENTFDSDPGWSTEGQWAFGTPSGLGGNHGAPDPTTGFTGNSVYGYNLMGDYDNNMPAYHLTSQAIDCTGFFGVKLSYCRWLGVERSLYDHAYLRASSDGNNWITIWENPDAETADSQWQMAEFDISAVADNQPTVYLRWTMGTTDVGWTYCGWNIDDVRMTAFVCDDGLPGDLNCDGKLDFGDINPFVLALTDPQSYQQQYPDCNILNGDINEDGKVDFNDINPFVKLLTDP